MATHQIEISKSTIIFTVFFLLGLYVLYQARDILTIFFFAVILSAALNPTVTLLQKLRLPRGLSIAVIYVALISVIAGLLSYVIPTIVRETAKFFTEVRIPQLPRALDLSQIQQTLQNYDGILSRIGGSIPSVFNAIFSTFSGIFVMFTLLVMTFYLLLERRRLHKIATWVFGNGHAEQKAENFVDAMEIQLGGWVRGQLTLMFIIGIMTYVGLALLGVPFALPLALLAGFLEFVPNLGPTIAAVPAVILAFLTMSPAMGVVVILFYLLVQQLENNLIVPKVMSAAVGIHPLIAILVLLTGLKFGGVIGMLLSVPLFITGRTVFDQYYDGKNPLRHEALK